MIGDGSAHDRAPGLCDGSGLSFRLRQLEHSRRTGYPRAVNRGRYSLLDPVGANAIVATREQKEKQTLRQWSGEVCRS
jgi:hypothetical protein